MHDRLPDDGGAGFQVVVEDLVEASWGMHQSSEDLLATTNALVGELATQKGTVGADEAGQLFGSVYDPAARTTVNQIGNACVIIGSGAAAILQTAKNYLAAESSLAAGLLAATGDGGSSGLATPWLSRSDQCQELHDPRGLGNSLPEAVGDTSWEKQFLGGGRYRGDPDGLRQIAATWRKAAGILTNVLADAQGSWTTAVQNHEGPASVGVNAYFTQFVGKAAAPARPAEGQTLLANLPAACSLLAACCESYADHIEAAQKQLGGDALSLLSPGPIWDNPLFGGNGNDGGLKDRVEGDADIHSLGAVAHILDGSQAVVTIPGQPNSGQPLLPWLPGGGVREWGGDPLSPDPFPDPIVLASVGFLPTVQRPRNPLQPDVDPIAPPDPPDPRFPALTPAQLASFTIWQKSLTQGDFSDAGNIAAQAYQLRTSGYPEFALPLPAGSNLGATNTLMVDGIRPTDGMAVEAKYVQNPKSCYRTLDSLLTNTQNNKRHFLYADDRTEMAKYRAALANPQNQGQLRGVEVDTNNETSVAYWDTMLALYGVNGYARYVA
ncbi:restriction endonuclease fold toxin-2 domain-containing protein [Kitasatospora sp. NPDC048194]|uniref:restriction endonuclease fold toxin-2 domain-containing protein n=1 Tax=Kitasatospora sp. NPDC048194 TaxID=3364045 RepID=UPI00371A26BA